MELFSFAVLGLLIVISPGADFVLIVKNSLGMGRKAGILTALGIASGIGVHITYSLVGISYLISQNQFIFDAIRYAGAAYLVYIGIKGLLATRAPANSSENPLPPATSNFACLRQGFFCNVLNPKTMLFFLSIFSQLVDASPQSSTTALIYGLYMVALHGIWFSLVATLFTSKTLSQWMMEKKVVIEKICGAALISFGSMLVLKS